MGRSGRPRWPETRVVRARGILVVEPLPVHPSNQVGVSVRHHPTNVSGVCRGAELREEPARAIRLRRRGVVLAVLSSVGEHLLLRSRTCLRIVGRLGSVRYMKGAVVVEVVDKAGEIHPPDLVRDGPARGGVGLVEHCVALIDTLYGGNHPGLGVVGRAVGDPLARLSLAGIDPAGVEALHLSVERRVLPGVQEDAGRERKSVV